VGKFAKPIEAAFTPHKLVPGPLDPSVPKVMSYEEFSQLETKEIVRIGAKIVERFERLFRVYGIARTGDDFDDFRNLALQMAMELFPDFRFKDNATLLELLFPLYGLFASGSDAFDYQLLVTRMAKDYFPADKQPSESKPSSRLALLSLLADVEAIQLERTRSRPYSGPEAIKKLMAEEPFKTRWGDVNAKTLRNWLGAARKLFERAGDHVGPSPKSENEKM
jgi:hypothetical protein